MRLEIGMKMVALARAARYPLARVPTSVKFSGSEDGLRALRHRQLGIENRTADLQMRVERFPRDEKPHDFTRAFENCVHTTIAQKSFHRDRRLATASE